MNYQKNQKVIDAVINYPIHNSFGILYGEIYKPVKEIKNKKILIKKHIFNFIKLKYGLNADFVLDFNRKAERVTMRQYICLYCRENDYSLNQIGALIGGRDHTTVLNNLNKANNYLKFDDYYEKNYKAFVRSFDIYLSGI